MSFYIQLMKVYSLGSGMDRLQMSAISFNKADNCSNLIYPAFSEIATACLYLFASLHSNFIQFNWNIIYIDSQKSWATDKALLLYIHTLSQLQSLRSVSLYKKKNYLHYCLWSLRLPLMVAIEQELIDKKWFVHVLVGSSIS